MYSKYRLSKRLSVNIFSIKLLNETNPSIFPPPLKILHDMVITHSVLYYNLNIANHHRLSVNNLVRQHRWYSVLLVAVLGGDATFLQWVFFVYHNNYSLYQLPFTMYILINYYKTMHTVYLSEMIDDGSISLTCHLWALVVITIPSSILQYTIKS